MPRTKPNPELGETLLSLQKRMQSGVAATYQQELVEAGVPRAIARELKHLRVGVNTAMTETAAIVLALEEKGILTSDEYFRACITTMGEEVERYTEEVRKKYGPGASLGEAGGLR